MKRAWRVLSTQHMFMRLWAGLGRGGRGGETHSILRFRPRPEGHDP